MVVADLTKWVAWGPVGVKRITAYNPNIGAVYIQLFQTPTVTAADVPVIKSLLVPASSQVAFEYTSKLALSELLVALSSTEASYTAVGAGAGLDMYLIVDSDFLVTSTTTLSGDLTTGVANRAVWTTTPGGKRLLRLDFKNNLGAVAYPYISATDAPAAKNSAQNRLNVVANGATKNYFFGKNGYLPRENTATDGTIKEGCAIVASASGDIGTTTLVATASFNIRAIYDTVA